MMKTIEEWPRPVLAPTSWKRLGKPCVVVPLYDAIPPSAHTCASVRPPRPWMRSAMGCSVVWKPVATTITSTGRSTPSAVTTASPVTLAIGSVTRSTWSRARAG